MPKVKWSKDLETENANIDNQHKMLFYLIEKLSNSISEKETGRVIQTVTANLTNYIIEHFADEEDLMIQENYPGYKKHKSIHEDLVIEAAEIVEQYHNKELVMTSPLVIFLMEWINEHIKKEDMDFVKWLKNK